MKKLSKLHIILIGILILVVAGSVYIFFSFREAESKLPEIRNEIKLAMMQLTVAQDKSDLDDLKQQLSELEVKINQTQAGESPFPKKVPSVEISDLIIDTVDKLDLELRKLMSDSEAGTKTIKSSEDAEGTKYNEAAYEVKVRGYLGRINSLIAEIEGATFATLVIEDLEFKLEEEKELTTLMWEAEFTIITLYLYEEETD